MDRSRLFITLGIAGGLAVAGVGSVVLAQGKGGGGASAVPIDPSGSFEVSGVAVDVKGKDADAARQGGWRLAQRKGWEMLAQRLAGSKSTLSDSALDAIVTGIIVEREQIGPNRYIAKLGVLFDRNKAGSILGVSTAVSQSQPMLLVPLQFSGGAGTVFERETAWAKAWNRFRSGGSTIDYVRLRGTGPDSLLVNAGQTLRRGRNWWRTVLDQYGATDVLVAEVQLRRDYPGGPVVAVFAASHGPDRTLVATFALRVDSADGLDTLLDQGVQRIDEAFRNAMASGLLTTDTLLVTHPPKPRGALPEPDDAATPVATPTPEATDTASAATGGGAVTIQFDTPNAGSVNAGEAALRGIPGVRSAVTTSLALGGVSVMRVGYDGSLASLRALLEGRGWQVQEGAGTLRIRRAPSIPAPAPLPGGANGE